MKATVLEMKKEAIKRLGMLNVQSNVISNFEKGLITVSEQHFLGNIPVPALSLVDEREKAFIEQFEKKYNMLIYHVVFTPCEFGYCLSFMYVSNVKKCWEVERVDLRLGMPYVYEWNITDDTCSGFVHIGIVSCGGIVRIA